MKNRKTLLYIGGALAVMALIFYWLMQGESSTQKGNSQVPVVAPHEIRNTEVYEDVDGKRIWQVQIGSMIYDKKRDTNVLKTVKGKFFREDGSVLDVSARAGEVSMKTKNLILSGDAKGVLSTGGTVMADKLTWVDAKKLIIAEGHVKIVKDDLTATGNKGTMDTGLEKLKLEGKAKVVKGAKE